MGSYEGALRFSVEPAAGDHPRGGLGRPGEQVVGSLTHPVMPNLVVLWKMSPLRGGRSAGRSQVVSAGPRPPVRGRNGAHPAARGGGGGPGAAAGGGGGGQPGLFFKHLKYQG
jgi:hypothetical protein